MIALAKETGADLIVLAGRPGMGKSALAGTIAQNVAKQNCVALFSLEMSETELAQPEYEGYKAGQLVGKGGLEKQYETRLRGKEGVRFVEVDARGRVVREAGARQDLLPVSADSLPTNIDMRLQRYIVQEWGNTYKIPALTNRYVATGLAVVSSDAAPPSVVGVCGVDGDG